jgi:5-methyltetrahydropteroyltriglutamate--homocysteine methyltransferase
MSRLNEGAKRILTTHTGSLPRPDALSALLFARMTKQPYDPAEMQAQTKAAVAATVRKQMEAHIDIVSDGEQSKTSFQLYATERLGGLTPIKAKLGERRTRENINFPSEGGSGKSEGRAGGRRPHRRLHALRFALKLRGADGESVLQDRRRAYRGRRRSAAP